jgi:hypothetical protein
MRIDLVELKKCVLLPTRIIWLITLLHKGLASLVRDSGRMIVAQQFTAGINERESRLVREADD